MAPKLKRFESAIMGRQLPGRKAVFLALDAFLKVLKTLQVEGAYPWARRHFKPRVVACLSPSFTSILFWVFGGTNSPKEN